MTTAKTTRMLRLGAARRLTCATGGGDYVELNPMRFYVIPPGE